MRTNMFKIALASAVLLAAVTGCSKKEDSSNSADSPAAPSLADANNPQALAKAAEAQRQAALPQADPATPESAYLTIDSGNQLMHLYYAVSGMPPDMAQIAEQLSDDYRRTQDGFKRQDIIKALEPRVKADIAAATRHRYVIWEADTNLIDHYDFERKLFPVQPQFWKGDSDFYFNDNPRYRISFSGAEVLRGLPVSDEALAREIEAKVGKFEIGQFDALRLRVYAFVRDVDLNRKTLKAQTVKLELRDKRGKLLASSSL